MVTASKRPVASVSLLVALALALSGCHVGTSTSGSPGGIHVISHPSPATTPAPGPK